MSPEPSQNLPSGRSGLNPNTTSTSEPPVARQPAKAPKHERMGTLPPSSGYHWSYGEESDSSAPTSEDDSEDWGAGYGPGGFASRRLEFTDFGTKNTITSKPMQSGGFGYAPIDAENVFESAISAIVETASNSGFDSIWGSWGPEALKPPKAPSNPKAPVAVSILERGQGFFRRVAGAPTTITDIVSIVPGEGALNSFLSQRLDSVLEQSILTRPEWQQLFTADWEALVARFPGLFKQAPAHQSGIPALGENGLRQYTAAMEVLSESHVLDALSLKNRQHALPDLSDLFRKTVTLSLDVYQLIAARDDSSLIWGKLKNNMQGHLRRLALEQIQTARAVKTLSDVDHTLEQAVASVLKNLDPEQVLCRVVLQHVWDITKVQALGAGLGSSSADQSALGEFVISAVGALVEPTLASEAPRVLDAARGFSVAEVIEKLLAGGTDNVADSS